MKIILLLSLFCFNILKSQSLLFEKVYGGALNDRGYSGFQTPDGGYIFCGNTSTSTDHYYYLVKTDSIGDTLWTRRYKSDPDNWAYRIHPTKDSCYMIAGYTSQWSNIYAHDMFLLKVKTNGDSIWGKTYGIPGTYCEEAYDAIQTKKGDFVMTGQYAYNGYSHYYVVKTNAAGTQKWFRNYNVALSSSSKSIIETLDGHYAICGPAFNSSYNHIGLAKVDSAGGPSIWFKNINVGNGEQLPTQLMQLPDSSFIILASINVNNPVADMCIVKTNSKGDTLFTKKFAKGRCNSIDKTSDNGYVVGGYSSGSAPLAKLVKLNANFDTLWTKTYPQLNGYSITYINEAHQTADKGFILIGMSLNGSNMDALLIKTDSVGNIIPHTINIAHMKAKEELLVYPNPFNKQTKIILPVELQNSCVVLINMMGIEVKKYYADGTELLLNKENLPAGTYTLLIQTTGDAGIRTYSQKIIIE